MRYSEVGNPEIVLGKVTRKAARMFTRKRFRKPDEKVRVYQMPTKVFRTNGKIDCCMYCERPTAFGSTRCRECFQKVVRARYEEKVRKEDERLRLVNEAFETVTKRKEIIVKKAKNLP